MQVILSLSRLFTSLLVCRISCKDIKQCIEQAQHHQLGIRKPLPSCDVGA